MSQKSDEAMDRLRNGAICCTCEVTYSPARMSAKALDSGAAFELVDQCARCRDLATVRAELEHLERLLQDALRRESAVDTEIEKLRAVLAAIIQNHTAMESAVARLQSDLKIAEKVRDEARAASQRDLDLRRDAESDLEARRTPAFLAGVEWAAKQVDCFTAGGLEGRARDSLYLINNITGDTFCETNSDDDPTEVYEKFEAFLKDRAKMIRESAARWVEKVLRSVR